MGFYYKTNFLTDVIFKIEFPTLLNLKDKSPSEFQNAIIEKFPDVEEGLISIPTAISGGDISSLFSPDKLWIFKDLSGDKFVELSKNHLLLKHKKYNNFKEFNENFQFIFDIFKKFYGGEGIVKKTGLRYVNEIQLSNGNVFKWEEYLKGGLLSAISMFVKDKKTIQKSLHKVEFKEGEFEIRVMFGMPNPDYPNDITKKFFLLDYDCVCKQPIKIQEISNRLIESHNHIKKLFEDNILDELRKEIVVIDNGS